MQHSGRAEFAKLQEAMQHQLRTDAHELGTNWGIRYPGSKAPNRQGLADIAADEMEKKFYAESKADMSRASNYNPYKVNHAYTVKGWKGNPDNPVKAFVEAQIGKGVSINDQILLNTLRKQIKAGVVLPAVAAQALVEYYQEAIDRNNRTRDFNFMSLNSQDSYIIRPMASKVSTLDLTNSLSVEKFLTNEVIISRGGELAARFGSNRATTLGLGGADIESNTNTQEEIFTAPKPKPERKQTPTSDVGMQGIRG
jgi:hypothetical protein